MVHVGELWRYITSLPPPPSHPLKTVIGNGLTEDLWRKMVDTYGVERVVEHYGATEMPGDALLQWFQFSSLDNSLQVFLNLHHDNYRMGRCGSCGFIPRHKDDNVLIQFDTESGKAYRIHGVLSVKIDLMEHGECRS